MKREQERLLISRWILEMLEASCGSSFQTAFQTASHQLFYIHLDAFFSRVTICTWADLDDEPTISQFLENEASGLSLFHMNFIYASISMHSMSIHSRVSVAYAHFPLLPFSITSTSPVQGWRSLSFPSCLPSFLQNPCPFRRQPTDKTGAYLSIVFPKLHKRSVGNEQG